MYLSLQHSNIPMNNCFVFVFVIYCVGVKLWTHINIFIMFFMFFVIHAPVLFALTSTVTSYYFVIFSKKDLNIIFLFHKIVL